MSGLGQDETHFWLTRSMARSVGVNLGDAMSQGRLSVDGYVQMVTRCRQADCADRCALWLGAQAALSPEPPAFCAHCADLSRLRHGHVACVGASDR